MQIQAQATFLRATLIVLVRIHLKYFFSFLYLGPTGALQLNLYILVSYQRALDLCLYRFYVYSELLSNLWYVDTEEVAPPQSSDDGTCNCGL